MLLAKYLSLIQIFSQAYHLKQFHTNSIFLKTIVYALLFGQIWTCALPDCSWMDDPDSDPIELFSSSDNDSEDVNKTEKIDKLKPDSTNFTMTSSVPSIKYYQVRQIRFVHFQEIPTPPPDAFG